MSTVRQLYAADLAQFPADPQAFEAALAAYHQEYYRFWSPSERDEEAHCDAVACALERSLHVYLREAGRS